MAWAATHVDSAVFVPTRIFSSVPSTLLALASNSEAFTVPPAWRRPLARAP